MWLYWAAVYALNALSGTVLWQTRIEPSGGVISGAPTLANGTLYIGTSSAEEGSAVNPRYECCKFRGSVTALDAKTGSIRGSDWKTPHPGCGDKPSCSPAQSAAVTAIPGVVFSKGLDGHLRAYTTSDGKIIWDVDTVREYETVNGVKATGGALDGPGAVVVDGMLYVNSGYAFIGGIPGNVLLAFSVDGR